MNNEEDTSNKKLTLQGFNKFKLSFNLGSSSGLSGGATIVKRRRKTYKSQEQDVSKLGLLTKREQIFRINALHNAALLKEKKLREEKKEVSVENDRNIDDKNDVLDSLFKEVEEKPSIALESVKLTDLGIEDNGNNKKPLKISKDIYSKHSKMVIAQSIDDKIEPSSLLRQRFSIRNKKSKFIKGKNISREVVIPDEITIRELSVRMAEDSKNVLRMLEEEVGRSYMINDFVDPDIACAIVEKFHHRAKRISYINKEKDLLFIENKDALPKKFKPPVVTFMGHVDHGKTSLLDAFLGSSIAEKESGGITQRISAYQVVTKNNRKITFVDTPGHEAFSIMRACGVNITNIVVIVIAADDGVMKQTIEAINYAKLANISVVVAINKIDKSKSGDVDKIVSSLPQYGLIPERLGGDVMVVSVSARKKINLDKLEEAILLISDLMKFEAIEDCRASGWVIDSKIDKASGVSAMLIVEEGTLKIGDILVAGTAYGRVRNMVNYFGQREVMATPSTPIEVSGLSSVPDAGDKFVIVSSERQAREIVKHRLDLVKRRENSHLINNDLSIFTNDYREEEKLALILKCDVNGSVHAISTAIDKLGKGKIKLNILYKAVGEVTDSDVLLAETSGAVILAFNIKIDLKIRDLAKQKGVEIRTYNVIYELIDSMKICLNKMLKPIIREVYIGSVSIRQIFSLSKAGYIVGCYVSDGVIRKDSLIKVIRNNKLMYQGKLKALRRFKDDVKEVSTHFECGIFLDIDSNIKVGDTLEVYQLAQEERAL